MGPTGWWRALATRWRLDARGLGNTERTLGHAGARLLGYGVGPACDLAQWAAQTGLGKGGHEELGRAYRPLARRAGQE